jgi:hypothetical protein
MGFTAEELARMGAPQAQGPTVTLDLNKYVRVIAPGIDITAKLTPSQVSELVAFTLNLVNAQAPAEYNGPA